MTGRIVVEGVKLAVVIRNWLRSTPDRLWGADPNYEALKKLKRHDPELAPDPRREVADYIVARIEELDWEVTQPEPEMPVSPPPYRGDG
ncbi:MAG TPA: hypothetical protein VIL42_09225 [Sphingomicrobium sp.]|jgi:hypothetical protein